MEQKETIQRATPLERKFPAGIILTTPGALETFEVSELNSAMRRHLSGDWGEMSPVDIEANEFALQHQNRLFSSYKFKGKGKLWIITEADRRATTMMLPSEY